MALAVFLGLLLIQIPAAYGKDVEKVAFDPES